MKKHFTFIFIIILSLNTFAQKNPETRASALTATMTKALSLNKEQQAKVYKIQLDRFQEVVRVKKIYQNNPEKKRAELEKIYNKLYGKLKGNLGEEKMILWQEYKRNN